MKPISVSVLLSMAFISASLFAGGTAIEPVDQFDRLDGTGPSRAKVDVIEWETNLELHVYPKGTLKGLGMKIDRENKNKPVMVIAYRLNTIPYTLYRRAILTLPIKEGFKTFKDKNETEFDKIFISNNTLTEGVTPYPLDAEPKQLHPDHFDVPEKKSVLGDRPAGKMKQIQQTQEGADGPSSQGAPSKIDEDGGIKGFNF